MSARHIDLRLIESFEAGAISAPSLLRFLGDHLADCPQCRPEIERWAAKRSTAVPSGDTGAALLSLLRDSASKPSTEERRRAEQDLKELLDLQIPDRQLHKVDRALTRFRSPLLANMLLDECMAERLRDPEAAEHYVGLAQKILWRAPASSYADEARVRSYGHLGAACKAGGKLDEAEQAFATMRALQKTIAVHDLAVLAEIYALEGSYLKDRRNLKRSEQLLRKSIELYELQHEELEAARIRMVLGMNFYRAGRLEEAGQVTRQAAAAIDPKAEPLLNLMAHHNITLFTCELGDYKEAARQLAENVEQYHAVRALYSIVFAHFHWLAGKIHFGLGQLETATDHFARARDSFLQHGTRYDAVLVCLDLCIVHLQAGRPDEVLELADLMLHSYAADGLHQEAMAAVRLFAEAARAKAVHTGFVREVFRFLELSQADPTYRCNLSVPDGD